MTRNMIIAHQHTFRNFDMGKIYPFRFQLADKTSETLHRMHKLFTLLFGLRGAYID